MWFVFRAYDDAWTRPDQPEFSNLIHISASVWPPKKLNLMKKSVRADFLLSNRPLDLSFYLCRRFHLGNDFFLPQSAYHHHCSFGCDVLWTLRTIDYCVSAAANIQNNIVRCVAIVGRIWWFTTYDQLGQPFHTKTGPTNRFLNKSNFVDVGRNGIGIKRKFHTIRTGTCCCVWISCEDSLNLCAEQMCYIYV